ncbi:hypothetical protein E2562_016548 [Oryza meyeriana var. granulata]|uniref:Uncharacterized protein n=1 Tax=Oryza meyeriana var. granulata TaxID=110450 RepID=A0A6G1C583_9ORYZ|nr:hypothetical protein E2562_016548 [Oryza meyeriana var. granulata]
MKVVSSTEKKEQLNDDGRVIKSQTEGFNEWLAKMESMDGEERKEYTRQNNTSFCIQKKAAIKKVMQKYKQKTKRKRKMLSPILGAVLKFHKDDDVDPPGGCVKSV